MEKKLMSVLGTTAKHILGSLQTAFRKMFIAGLLTAVFVAIATYVVSAVMTGTIMPSGLTHLAAAALAIGFGYAVAVTVALEEILHGIIKGIELIVQETEKLAGEALHEAEKLGKEAITGAGSLERGVAGAVAGAVGGAGREFHSVEQGIASHLPGHHNS